MGPILATVVLAAIMAVGLGGPAVRAQMADPMWPTTLEQMNLDLEEIGASGFAAGEVDPANPFGTLPISLSSVDVNAVGERLASLTREEVVEVLQRCRVIVDNAALYSAIAIAYCTTAFDIVRAGTERAPQPVQSVLPPAP
jgi:hypothetical protein